MPEDQNNTEDTEHQRNTEDTEHQHNTEDTEHQHNTEDTEHQHNEDQRPLHQPATTSVPNSAQDGWLHELWELFHLGWPLTLSVLTNFAPRVVVLAIVGHLPDGGPLVGAAGIGIMFANMSGQMLLKSTAIGVTSLLAQAFGAQNYKRCGHVLMRILLMHAIAILLVALPLTVLAHSIFLAVGQPAAVSANASLFAWIRLAGLPFSALTNDLTTFLNAQRSTRTPMVANILGSVTQVGLAVVLVDSVGFVGAPLAMTLVEVLQGLLLLVVTPRLLSGQDTSWPLWSEWRQATTGWAEIVVQGAPCAVMIVSEWGGWESALFLAGPLCEGKDSCPEVEAIPICTTLLVFEFICVFGPGQAVVNRIGNLLGAGKPHAARLSAQVAFACASTLGFGLASIVMNYRREIAELFVDDEATANAVVDLMPLTILYSSLATLGPGWSQMVLFGVGCSLKVPAIINFTLIFVIGLPIGTALAYGGQLRVRGLWIGLVLAIFGIFLGHVVYIVCTVDWGEAAELAVRKASKRESKIEDLGDIKQNTSVDLHTNEKGEYLTLPTVTAQVHSNENE